MADALLEVQDLSKYFPVRKGFWRRKVGDVKAVDHISFTLKRGQTMGLVGESGCGKSTLGRAIIRLYEPSGGKVLFRGKDFTELRGAELRSERRNIQMIFQDPYASLDPRMTVAALLEQPFKIHGGLSPSERRSKVEQLIRQVGLRVEHLNRYPHEFSGGQRQRICIARAIALEPELIIADEAVSALDVSIQAQILNLMKDLQDRLKLTYLFISHDMAVIEHMCDEVAVMYLGRIVEQARKEDFFKYPKHPYTQALLEAIPEIGESRKAPRRLLHGEVPSPLNPPTGCAFHPRCPHKMDICTRQAPPSFNVLPTAKPVTTTITEASSGITEGVQSEGPHKVACWLFKETTT